MDASFVMRKKLEHETAWLLRLTEHLALHHHYTNNCTMIRYNGIQICGKPPTCFGIFRPKLGSYSTKKITLMACYTILKIADIDRNLQGVYHTFVYHCVISYCSCWHMQGGLYYCTERGKVLTRIFILRSFISHFDNMWCTIRRASLNEQHVNAILQHLKKV